ncbi:YdgA family protein [Zobellella sp. DQSA1]|uniref:YdgA family protein n=1 Tax=Zobellella sp. DQSA1 TaxID=3342386 RepID=UPI0035BEC8D2
MKRALISTAIAAAATVGLYTGTQYYIGTRISAQVDAWRQQAAAHEELWVARLDYEQGLSGGALHYDLTYRPLPTNPLHELLAEWQPTAELRLQGSLPVEHGPWLGRDGLGQARLEYRLPLPDTAREWLPDYPEQAPMLTLTGVQQWDGSSSLRLQLIDYRGHLAHPGADGQLDLALADSHLNARWHPQRQRLQLQGQIGKFALDLPASTERFSLQQLSLTLDATAAGRYLWLGDSALTLQQLRFSSQKARFGLQDALISTHTTQEQQHLNSHTEIALGGVSLPAQQLGPSRLRFALNRLETAPYQALLQRLEQLDPNQDPDAQWQHIQPLLEQLLAYQPELGIEELSLSLADPYDTTASAILRYTGTGKLDSEQLPRQLQLAARAQASDAAFQQFLSFMIAEESPGLSAQEQQQILAASSTQMKELLLQTPFVVQQDERLQAEIVVENGEVSAHGQAVMSTEQLLEASGLGTG